MEMGVDIVHPLQANARGKRIEEEEKLISGSDV